MSRQTHVPLLVAIAGAILSLLICFVLLLPQFAMTNELRRDIDTTRLLLESLRNEQKNVEAVRQDVAKIEEARSYVDDLSLWEARSIPFFNQIDELFASSGINNPNTRLDTPSTPQPDQALAVHFTFTATFEQTLKFLRGLHTLDQSIAVDSVSFRNDEKNKQSNITIDSVILWRRGNP